MYAELAHQRQDPVARITPIDSAVEANKRRRREEETELLVQVGDHEDRDAFARLYGLFAPRITAYLHSMGHDTGGPEAVTQEVMLAVWTKAKLFNPAKASARTWIYTLARNRYIDLKRARRREYSALDRLESTAASAIDDGESAANHADTSGVAELLKDMPEEQAEVLLLAYVEGYSHREIAEKLGISIGTAKSRARLAFKKLRDRMGVSL